jgi:hypothetical protein
MAWGKPFPKGVLSTPKPIQKGQRLSPATEFKKGCSPANKLPIGSVTVRQHRGDSPRAWVKVAEPNTWALRAAHVWEGLHGPIPPGQVIHHEDGDTLNDQPDNLRLITKAEHRQLHNAQISAGRQRGRRPRRFVENRVPLKGVTCTGCGATFRAKYQRRITYCDCCRKQRRAAIARSYQRRVRASRRA